MIYIWFYFGGFYVKYISFQKIKEKWIERKYHFVTKYKRIKTSKREAKSYYILLEKKNKKYTRRCIEFNDRGWERDRATEKEREIGKEKDREREQEKESKRKRDRDKERDRGINMVGEREM